MNTTINTTEEVTTSRTVANRQLESIIDLNNTQQTQWSESPGAFESTFTTQVNLTYAPVAHNIPLVKHGYHSSAPKEVIRLEDDIMLSYNLSTNMNHYNTKWSFNNATTTYGRTFTYGGLPSTTETVSTINYPWVSVYYQMNNLPGWLSVWQSYAQMSYKMYNQNFQQAYYAANLYNDYMWD